MLTKRIAGRMEALTVNVTVTMEMIITRFLLDLQRSKLRQPCLSPEAGERLNALLPYSLSLAITEFPLNSPSASVLDVDTVRFDTPGRPFSPSLMEDEVDIAHYTYVCTYI